MRYRTPEELRQKRSPVTVLAQGTKLSRVMGAVLCESGLLGWSVGETLRTGMLFNKHWVDGWGSSLLTDVNLRDFVYLEGNTHI